ncbi:hypothetical protein CI105_07420 [Candidatus Izimaplasma bacterium ZiA1]|uniref:NAD(P)/FAD-dependent oxidoreductase n=1 Tax=Candidatus Izimoplasma sp. ZiA1 TaxID=2024899 RepID=UPI000BAA4E70|nr:hypothetical protein CI105_07420 [Candidatus Izimaplasma bacterium ZiA1]
MYDVLIIGSGITGACISREMSKYQAKTIIIEKENDVAQKATLANSAIVHSGHDPIPGTLKAKFNILGNRMYKQMSEELDIPLMECGGLVVATTLEEEKTLDMLYARAFENGLKKSEVKLLTKDEVKEKEPNISDHVTKALSLPSTSVTYPLEAAIANIENAMNNGVELATNEEVISIVKNKEHFEVFTKRNKYEAKVVINASGINAENISKMIAKTNFTISPRKGEYYVLDKDVTLVNSVIYPTPSEKGKGVLVTPQYHGNTLLGPTSEFVENDTESTTKKGLDYIKVNIEKTVTNIPYNKIIRSFAGSRPTPSTKDFIIEESNIKGFINVAGIESPGLTAAPAIARYVVEGIVANNIDLVENKNFNPYRKKVIRMNELSDEEKNELYKRDSRFANIICRCESITEGEIIEAIHRNCGATTVTGVKNRVRAGAGRCQGGFCQPEVLKILARELKIDPMEVLYSKKDSAILKAKTKGE